MSTSASSPLSVAEREEINKQRVPFPLSPYEIQVIKFIRKVGFGQVTLHLQNSVVLRATVGASYNIDPYSDNIDDILQGKDK